MDSEKFDAIVSTLKNNLAGLKWEQKATLLEFDGTIIQVPLKVKPQVEDYLPITISFIVDYKGEPVTVEAVYAPQDTWQESVAINGSELSNPAVGLRGKWEGFSIFTGVVVSLGLRVRGYSADNQLVEIIVTGKMAT